MERMSYHVVDFLAQGSGALFRRGRLIHPIESAFGPEPLPPDAVVVGPLERPDEISFKEALISSNFCLCSGVSSSYVIGSPFDIPMVEVDVVGIEGPTGRARMCCWPKPPDGRRQAT
jgi:hypothetical protein